MCVVKYLTLLQAEDSARGGGACKCTICACYQRNKLQTICFIDYSGFEKKIFDSEVTLSKVSGMKGSNCPLIELSYHCHISHKVYGLSKL